MIIRSGLPRVMVYIGLAVGLVAGTDGAAADDAPTIAKDSIRVKAQDDNKDPGAWSPEIEFRVNGPIASGSQLSVAFSLPTKPKWVEFDCDTGEIKKGEWWKTECPTYPLHEKAVPFTGTVGFTIRLRNELLGTNSTLFTGKAQVVKVPRHAGSKSFYYYVNDDWTIPIGYVYFQDFEGRGSTDLKVGFWYRGAPPSNSCHLFYQGKEVAKDSNSGNDAGSWDPSKHVWGMEECQFQGVYRTEKEAEDGYDPKFSLEKNPGEYEVKVLIVNRLARSIKFTVGPDGSFDNGIATANKLGSDRTIVPVQVIGNQGPWDKLAWKTGAYYGNPLSGFTPAP